MKFFLHGNDLYEAERIYKYKDSVKGYNGDTLVFSFEGISDFSHYDFSGVSEFNNEKMSDKERIESLEELINQMLMGGLQQ